MRFVTLRPLRWTRHGEACAHAFLTWPKGEPDEVSDMRVLFSSGTWAVRM